MNGPFSMAMLNNQRVYETNYIMMFYASTGFCHLVISDVQNLASYPCNLEGTC
jgi:hypothetical protein